MAKQLPIESFQLKNFKAIRDSGPVEFTPLTVLIGENGSGKSSLVEGLETYNHIVKHQANVAMRRWLGFQHIAKFPVSPETDSRNGAKTTNAIEIDLHGSVSDSSFQARMGVINNPKTNETIIDYEQLYIETHRVIDRDRHGHVTILDRELTSDIPPDLSVLPLPYGLRVAVSLEHDDENLLALKAWDIDFDWQFVRLRSGGIGYPQTLERSGWKISLESNGSNIAEYILDLRRQHRDAYDGVVETLQHILPYASAIEPVLTNDLERQVYIKMIEREFEVPGWLLSTGSLRILCLLALFRHPKPPPLIVIEEIENGLDPRAIHLIVDEMRDLVDSGRSQLIVTTHSPYLLNLMPLSSIVLVERKDGEPTFSRPADREDLDNWSRRFAPGDLYTMGALSSENGA